MELLGVLSCWPANWDDTESLRLHPICSVGSWTSRSDLLLAQVASESKMAVDVEEYVSSFRTDLCDVLAAWSRGSKFGDIMKMTDVFEVHCSPSAQHNAAIGRAW